MYAIFEGNRRKIFLLQVKRNLSYYTMLIAMLAMAYVMHAMIDVHKKIQKILLPRLMHLKIVGL